jgi:hypothetical protein
MPHRAAFAVEGAMKNTNTTARAALIARDVLDFPRLAARAARKRSKVAQMRAATDAIGAIATLRGE